MVLDDYHFIDSIPEIRTFINRFIQLAGENFHLILASRTLPFLPDLHLLAARNEVGGISFEDLAFLPDEIRAFFKQNSNQTISLDDARTLAEQTEGWVTSLTLSRLSPPGTIPATGSPGQRTGVEVFDYFAREILEIQPPDIRGFLLLTSLFDEVELELCNQVLAPLLTDNVQDWRKVFEKVQKSSLFVIPLGMDGRSFRYHHLFQDFLQMELQAKEPRLALQVKSRLAEYYVDVKDWEKAHFIYESLGDEDALVLERRETRRYILYPKWAHRHVGKLAGTPVDFAAPAESKPAIIAGCSCRNTGSTSAGHIAPQPGRGSVPVKSRSQESRFDLYPARRGIS